MVEFNDVIFEVSTLVVGTTVMMFTSKHKLYKLHPQTDTKNVPCWVDNNRQYVKLKCKEL
jgi:hypothetical protein